MIYRGQDTREISFPIGGIGSGCIGLYGNGVLGDFEIFNRPAKKSLNGYTNFAIRTVAPDGQVNVRILNGDLLTGYMGVNRTNRGMGIGGGPDSKLMCGFPHFREWAFEANYPFAKLTFSDPDFPGEVTLTAFNPMIPGDSHNSSIPAAFFRIDYTNRSAQTLDADFIFTVCNPFVTGSNAVSQGEITAVTLSGKGRLSDDLVEGDITAATAEENARVQRYWFRGKWLEGIVSYWNEMSSGADFIERNYGGEASGDHSVLWVKKSVAVGKSASAEFVFTWNIPVVRNYWNKNTPGEWKNWYATVWESSLASAEYSLDNFAELEKRTRAFTDTFYSTTVDPVVLEAAGSTMSVLRSPTVMRLENGKFYGWEGTAETFGSCEGTCQHVWNYAYALCFLFPELERSIRELELDYELEPDGKMPFRLMLPLGNKWNFRACLDGQTGEVFKLWREWKISGDTEWMLSYYPKIKLAMSYAWSKSNPDLWDPDESGVITGRQHHTLDRELFGPSSWLEGFYLLALRACAELADAAGDCEMAEKCRNIFEKGYEFTKKELFNGRWFSQKIDLTDRKMLEKFAADDYWNDETGEIKYQIAQGCEIDQMCAQWHSDILGLGRIFDTEQTRVALENMYKNNFKPDMRSFTNPWRVFALNDEAGAVICDYPEGVSKPKIPIPYCEESMHGFEYQFAGLLIAEGMIEQGLNVVRAVRERYRGHNRNPFNEIECGGNYARSMASFALLPIFAGMKFDLAQGFAGFYPIEKRENFRTFYALGGAWGCFEQNKNLARLTVDEGSLTLCGFGVNADGIKRLTADGIEIPFTYTDGVVAFAPTAFKHELLAEF